MILNNLRAYAYGAVLAVFAAVSIYAAILHHRVSFQAETIVRLEKEKRGLEQAVAAVEAVNATRSVTIRNLEGIKRDIQNEAEEPLPSPIASALMGLREQQLRAGRTGQPANLSSKPDSSR